MSEDLLMDSGMFYTWVEGGGGVEILSSVTFRDGVKELWWATDQQSVLNQYIILLTTHV